MIIFPASTAKPKKNCFRLFFLFIDVEYQALIVRLATVKRCVPLCHPSNFHVTATVAELPTGIAYVFQALRNFCRCVYAITVLWKFNLNPTSNVFPVTIDDTKWPLILFKLQDQLVQSMKLLESYSFSGGIGKGRQLAGRCVPTINSIELELRGYWTAFSGIKLWPKRLIIMLCDQLRMSVSKTRLFDCGQARLQWIKCINGMLSHNKQFNYHSLPC